MKLSFTLNDATEISGYAFRAFITTFNYYSAESDSDNSESDLSDFDSDMFGCGDITPEVENMVQDTWEVCTPLDEVYGRTSSEIIKKTIITATEETECAGLKFFNYITPAEPGENRNLIATCTEICFWCCCETIKKVSPIIAEATTNLII
jgi:hypothetical protein